MRQGVPAVAGEEPFGSAVGIEPYDAVRPSEPQISMRVAQNSGDILPFAASGDVGNIIYLYRRVDVGY